jgi:lipopolysaccharide export system ATP-binding protein
MSVLRSEKLSKSFGGREVVHGVNIRVQSGEIIGFLGRNGAGKTTTFQMVVGLVKPDGGAVYLDDKDISRSATPERARLGITYLPQENSVFLKASVKDNLRLILELLPYEDEEKEKLSRDLLEELGLLALSEQSAHSLSGGERRKLEICRSLVLKPKFLLLDEPFTGIDPLTIIDLQKILLRLKERDIGIIISDHNVRDTLRITDRAYILDEGAVLTEGSPGQIAADEQARKRFLGDDFALL